MPEDKAKGVVPPLRFPEFRGAGPWKVKRLGEVYRFKPTNSWPRDRLNYEHGTIKNIHYGDIHKGLNATFRIAEEVIPFIDEELATSISEDAFCEPGDIIFADASEDVADIGKAIEIVDTGGQKIVSGLHTILAHQIDQELVTGFGAYLFASSGIRAQIQQRAQGAKVLGISKSQLAEIILAYPKQEREQQKIADCLSSLDDLIRTEGERLAALKEHKKGLMQGLFPREGQTTPDLRFPEFRNTGPWEVKRLEEFCDINPPSGQLPPNFVYIDLESVEGGKLIQKKVISCNNAPSRAQRLLKRGDVIYQMVRPYQKNNLIFDPDDDQSYVASTGYAQLRAKGSNSFLYQLIHTEAFTNSVLAKCTGSNYPAISSSDLAEIYISAPSLSEQQKIADCLSSLDDLIRAQEARIEALKLHKKGLMQQLFPQEVN